MERDSLITSWTQKCLPSWDIGPTSGSYTTATKTFLNQERNPCDNNKTVNLSQDLFPGQFEYPVDICENKLFLLIPDLVAKIIS